MSIVTERKAPWFTKEYSHMVSVRYDAGVLAVDFADGARVRLSADELGSDRACNPDWSRLRYDDFEIVVPSETEDLEIPWSAIRVLTDPAFDAHLEAAAQREAIRAGRRVRELREGQALSLDELAARVGLTAEQLSRLEAGELGVRLEMLGRLVEAMGLTMREFIVAPEETQAARQRPARDARPRRIAGSGSS
jgi:DNA-binding Xre family transcriptional regulator